MDFLFGLDMLKRHRCCIDLRAGALAFAMPDGTTMEAPFLHEKDLDENKGGTKGFDADRSNKELEVRRLELELEQKEDGGGGGGENQGTDAMVISPGGGGGGGGGGEGIGKEPGDKKSGD